MNRLLLCVAVIALTCGIDADLRRGLRVKFNVGLGIGSDFFFDVPRTVVNATYNNWTITEGITSSAYSNLTTYCYSDRILCALFDSTDLIAGLQIAHDQSEFSGNPFDWETLGFSEWNPSVSSGETNRTYWATQIFFKTPDASSKQVQVKPTNDYITVLRDDDLWVNGFNKEIFRIPGDQEGIEDSIFTKQACIPWMGTHYYYNMTSETPCTDGFIFPWFPLVNNDRLEAVGLLVPGTLSIISGRRDWFERPGEIAVKAIVPNGPQCLYDLTSNYGMVTMHIYFTDQPWYIGCSLW